MASLEEQQQIEHTMAKLESFDYQVVNIGFHDYMAVPTEREGEVNRKLQQALGIGGASRYLLPTAIFSVVFLVVIIAAVVLWMQRRAKAS